MSVGPLVPAGLRCAHKQTPLSVETDRARFSWHVVGDGAGRRQTAYQVRVARDEAGLEVGWAWDSGRTEGDCSTGIDYAGTPLQPAHRYFWKARVWDEAYRLGPWSATTAFTTALDPRSGWEGCSWIGLGRDPGPFEPPSGNGPIDPVALAMKPAPYLRRTFTLTSPIVSARLYVTALGLYRVWVNGVPAGDNVLAPGWTDYSKRFLYQTYDVTEMLSDGENVIGAIVADGWACGFFGFDRKLAGAHYARDPQLLAQLVVVCEYEEQRIATDHTWRSSTGRIVYSDLLMGEGSDPGQEPQGWDRPGFDATAWRPVASRERGPAQLIADPGPPIIVAEEVPAKSLNGVANGEIIVDFGQNVAGWCRIRVDEPAGRLVNVRHGEVLAPEGGLYLENLRTARQSDTFSTSGGKEVLEPRFTFHGFRYAAISGFPGTLGAEDITACVVHSDTPRTGTFECSSPDVNRLFANIDWGQRGNFISVPTDCPQRDERLGWLGDAQVFVRTAAYNRDVASFFDKWLDDVSDAQLPSGAFTDFVPRLNHAQAASPAWGDAGVIVPWTIYKMYGDKSVLERNFGAMAAWMGYLDKANPDRLWTNQLGANYGDWLAPKGDMTPRELLATAYWAYDATLMAEVAAVIGRQQEAEEYERLAGEVGDAFRRRYVGPSGRIESGTQTAYVLALQVGLIPEDLRANSAAYLVEAIAEEDWHLSTGFVGVGYLLPVLSSNGYSEVAYKLLEQRSFPSWLYTIDRGATTIWERWDGYTDEHGFQSPRMNSFNHYSLGSVGEWLYRFVLGIELAPGASGFDRLVMRPHPGGSLSHARGSFRSVRGEICSAWERKDGQFRFDIQVPPNVRVSVRVPSAAPGDVVEAGGSGPEGVARYPGATGQEEAVFEVGSGSYSFSGPELDPTAGPWFGADTSHGTRNWRDAL